MRDRFALALGCALLWASLAGAAPAAEAETDDVLTLKDGRVLRGRVVVSTDREMMFRTADGKIHSIKASEIESHKRGSRTPPAVPQFRCKKCGDTGEFACRGCAGGGKAACRSCGGEKHTPCKDCGGKHLWTRSYFPGKPPPKPQMTMGTGKVKCRYCGGDGKLHVPRLGGGLVYADCTHCRRTGLLACETCLGRGWAQCAFCRATGRDPDAPCPDCGGKRRLACDCGGQPAAPGGPGSALGCDALLESVRGKNTRGLVGRRFRLPTAEIDYVARRGGRPEVVILLKLQGTPPREGEPALPAVEVQVYVTPAKGGDTFFEKLKGGDAVTGEGVIAEITPPGGKNDPVILGLRDAELRAAEEP